MKLLEELSRIESVGAKNKGKQEDKVGEGNQAVGLVRNIGEIGEGSFSDVLKTLSHRDGKYYACKHMKQHFESMEQVHNLREIQTLRRLSPYPNSFLLHEVVLFQSAGSLSLICELLELNICELIKGIIFFLQITGSTDNVYLFTELFSLVCLYWYRNRIFHRAVKPENILIKQNILKLGDFGSCRSIYPKQPHKECISACCFQPLFPGFNELDQISKIHDVIGTSANKTLNKFKQ
ncbi:unnamed protein product [Bubo scandiacus]